MCQLLAPYLGARDIRCALRGSLAAKGPMAEEMLMSSCPRSGDAASSVGSTEMTATDLAGRFSCLGVNVKAGTNAASCRFCSSRENAGIGGVVDETKKNSSC